MTAATGGQSERGGAGGQRGVRGLEPGCRAAVVIHEWQRGTVDPAVASIPSLAAHAGDRAATKNINALTAAARAAGVPVFWSVIEPRADRVGTTPSCLLLAHLRRGALAAGSEAAGLHPEVVTAESDIWIRRVHGLTPFHQTELEAYLRDLGVRTVVIGGVSTDVGVPGAALEAVNRGFTVVVPEDCTAGSSPATHDFVVRTQLRLLATVSDSASVIEALRAASAPAIGRQP
ncbi:nicotinamidase-like amidase [Frankia sp. EI5c]|uniref:cysteine hydrolase family protein n=1 Tax=Frankia sp. EI5c TaxID=683316 RepID=UPI0007C328AA|nr:cysteine hydrolase [Frankia sp. EI5c]OAA27398.1 nicotinamidase-like amidase [Frankia sp. EI5c]